MVQATVALRVYVDTRRGLEEGVPRLLDLFRRTGTRASFFVTMGPDRSGLAIRRVFRPGFLVKMWRTRALRLYGVRTLLSGTLLPPRLVGAGMPALLREIAAQGHEIALHGWDHVRWQDRVHRLPAATIRAELTRAAQAFEAALGVRPGASAAPGWRTSPEALAIQEEFALRYASDVRGAGPFRPAVNGRALETIQVPTTLPTLDELLGRVRDLPATLLKALRPGLNVFTLHAEVEGGSLLGTFAEFLEGTRRAGAALITLEEAAARISSTGDSAPVASVTRGRIDGRSGWVACQGLAWAPRCLVAVLAALLLVGCGSTFRRREVTVEQPRPPAEAERPVVQPPPEPPRLAEQLARVAGELSELQNAVAKLMASSRQQEDQVANLQRRLSELEAQNRGRAPAVPGGFAPGAPPPGPAPITSATTALAEDLYRSGVEKFRAKDFDAAVLVFYDLVVTYPEDPLRERAQFLVADIFYTQKDYRGALAEFEALLAAVPGGARTPDALLKIGLCERVLGDAVRARRTWERVVREFPDSVAARQARVLLRR